MSTPSGQPQQPPPSPAAATPQQPTTKFGGLAWAALILGIVGVVGSPILFVNNLTAVAAGVGVILGIIALFGTKKVVAGIGVGLSILAIVITVLVQQAAVEQLQELGENLGSPAGGDSGAAQLPVGKTYDGDILSITVDNPHTITTSDTSVPVQNAKAVVYEVTITNTGTQPVPMMRLSLDATSGDRKAKQVYDSANGLDSPMGIDVLPGKSFTYDVAFVPSVPGEMVIQVSLLGGDSVYFTHQRQQS